MRDLNELDYCRMRTPQVLDLYGTYGDDKCGVFLVVPPGPDLSLRLKVIAVSHDGWDHVSVSIADSFRTPSWSEMDWVKRIFFHKSEVAMQLHVAEDDHISIHPGALHLWRPLKSEIPLPPRVFV